MVEEEKIGCLINLVVFRRFVVKMPKKFRKRFRCGRAVLLSDGTVKKLNLSEGGGSRHSNWYHSYMNFESVRNDLIKMYHLGNSIGLIYSYSDFLD